MPAKQLTRQELANKIAADIVKIFDKKQIDTSIAVSALSQATFAVLVQQAADPETGDVTEENMGKVVGLYAKYLAEGAQVAIREMLKVQAELIKP